MTSREIVTLQIGHYANHVGTHWWNLQEASFSYDPKNPSEANHDIMFKEGLTQSGVSTYLPRLICVDVKGSLGSLQEYGSVYDQPTNSPTLQWPGQVDIQKTEPYPKNEYMLFLDNQEQNRSSCPLSGDVDKDICQASGSTEISDLNYSSNNSLDSSVKVWSDYLCMHLHPRSIHLINEYSHQNEVEPFNIYYYGQQVLSEGNQMEEIEDRLRYFVEECDNLQGFHLLMDGDSGFAGVGATIATYLNDEFSSKSIFTVPLFDVSTNETNLRARQLSVLNSFICLEKIAALSDLVLPLSCLNSLSQSSTTARIFPLLDYKAELPYHTSAILAAALDSVTMAYRAKLAKSDLGAISSIFFGRKISALTSVFPVPLYQDVSIFETFLKKHSVVTPQSLTPGCTVATNHSLHQNVVLRGLPLKIKLNIEEISKQMEIPNNISNLDELFLWYLGEICPSDISSLHTFSEPCRTTEPFPHIFHPTVSDHGLISSKRKPINKVVESVPIITGIHNSENIKDMLTALHKGINAIKIKNFDTFIEAGLDTDEFTQISENMRDLATCYNKY